MDLTQLVENLGLHEKAARVYLAALELGEATVQELAESAKLKRTSLYYILDELINRGAIVLTKRNKKFYYIAEEPRLVLKRARDRIAKVEEFLPLLEEQKHAVFPRPRISFLYGSIGFKQAWVKILSEKKSEYLIMTPAENFKEFVSEKYIHDEIIALKKKNNINSRQLIPDTAFTRRIVSKDKDESRRSKFLSPSHPLFYTEVVCSGFVVFISPREDDLIFIVESELFARTRRSAFNLLWEALP